MGGKKRCSSCPRWFVPEVRVRSQQKTCGLPECRKAQRRRQQAAWRARHREYAADWRLRQKVKQAEAAEAARKAAEAACQPLPPEASLAPAVPPGPSILAQVPWEFAKTAMGVQGTVLIGFLVGVCARAAKTAMRTHHAEIAEELARVRREMAEAASSHPAEMCEGPP